MFERFSSVDDLILGKLQSWFEAGVKMFPNLVIAAFFFLLFWIIAKVVETVLSRVLPRVSENHSVNQIISGIVRLVIVFVGLFVALGILKLDKTVTSLLAGAGVLGLALGFAFQDIASNFFSGILIVFQKPIKVGDTVKVGEFVGQIHKINLRTTVITTFEGLEVIVPNKELVIGTVINYTSTPFRRVDLSVGVSYGENLRKVKECVLAAVQEIPGRLKSREVECYFKLFDESSINFDVRVWLNDADEVMYVKARDAMVIAIKEAFDQNSITIPFPIRTLDFGIKGGQKLSEVLKNSPV